MVIAFDTFFLTKRLRNVGIYQYSKNLLREFRKMAEQDASIAIRYFASPGYSDDVVMEGSVAGCERVDTGLLRFHRLWRLGLVNVAAKRIHADLIFSPSPTIVPLGVLPVAVNIHDAMAERLPRQLMGTRTSSLVHRTIWRGAATLSQKVLAPSEYSKADVIQAYNLPPQKVSVVYLGYDRDIFNTSPVDSQAKTALLTRLGIQGPYILHHGMVHLRKNLGRLIQAYGILLDRWPSLGLQLVLAGQFGWGSEQIRQMANGSGVRGKVVFTGSLPSEDLASLVKGASLCVIPSLYEGFCLPMIEAMACGVPTIAANNSCMPEISGGMLRYFDALSEEDMAATMQDVLEHSELRQQLVTKGRKRAAEFTWRRCAQETWAALASVAEMEIPRACCIAP